MIDLDYDRPCMPVNLMYRGDCRADMAVQDRCLKAEAEDVDATINAVIAVNAKLYPPVISMRGLTIHSIVN